MDVIERRVLRDHHTTIVQDLEPRHVLPQLCQDGILTENDMELISEGATRRWRCQKLLSLLPTRGPRAYGSFMQALQHDGYTHISDVLHAALRQCTSDVREVSVDTPTCNNPETREVEEENVNTEQDVDADQGAQCSRCSEHLPSSFEDPELERLVRNHCCLLLDNIEPRDITDYPYQERLLTEDECEWIDAGATRKRRCAQLLCALASKPPARTPVAILMQALSKKYSFIVNQCTQQYQHAEEGNTRITTIVEEGDGSLLLSQQRPPIGERKTEKSQKPHGKEPMNCEIQAKRDNNKNRKKETRARMRNRAKQSNQKHTENKCENKENCDVMMYTSPASVSTRHGLASKQLVTTFNYMSSLINQGQFDKFKTLTVQLGRKFEADADMKCLLGYLQASRHLYENNYDAAKENIDSAMKLAPMTSNPKYFTVELFTAKTRMYISQKKLNKLEDTLDDVKQVIESDPVGCSGRAAGWLYMNDGRNKTAQLDLLNLSQPRATALYEHLFAQAKVSFTRALSNFEQDGGKDGPFGTGYAVCRLAILLLRCGDNGLTMDVMVPPEEDVRLAAGYIQKLEDSDIPINKILSLHYLLAKSDLQFRRSNLVRATEHAQAALQVAEDMNLQEFIEHAHNRVLRLRMTGRGSGPTVQEVTDEDEFNRLLETESERESSGRE